jgi:hypothetical protein
MRLFPVMAFAAIAVAAAACGGTASFTVAGEKVTNADAALEAVESRFRSDIATDDTVAVSDDARCYFLNVGESDIDSQAFCGPVGQRDAEGPFNAYWLESYPSDGGVELQVGGRGHVGVVVRDTGGLVRPDKQGLPDDLFVAPPALPPDVLISLEQMSYELSGGVDDTALVRFPQHGWGDGSIDYDETRIVALERTNVVGDGYGQLSAAEDHDLVVLQLDHVGDADLAVLIDGSRRVIEDSAARYHVISVPSGSDNVLLELRSGKTVQTLSLIDGSRGGDAPPLWYRDNTTTRLGHHLILTHEVTGADDGSKPNDFSLTFEVTYTDVELLERDRDGAPAPTGKVWLAVWFEGVRDFNDGPWSLRWEWDTNTTLVLDDGTVIEPVVNRAHDGGQLYFAVDDDFTAGTLQIAPELEWELTTWSGAISDRGSASLESKALAIDLG